MQFLYADGTDAHFMDSADLRADRDPGADARRVAQVDAPERRGRAAVDRRPADRPPAPQRRRARGHADGARLARRHRLRRRHEAGHARVGRAGPRAAVRQHGRPGARRHPLRRVRLARVGADGTERVARRSDQRRRAVFALYQHDVTGRPLEDTLAARRGAASRASSRRRRRAPARAGRADRPLRRGLGARAHRAAGALASAGRAAGDAAPGRRPRRAPDPAEVAIDEAVETAKELCGAEAPGFVNGILAAVLRERQAADADAGAQPARRAVGMSGDRPPAAPDRAARAGAAAPARRRARPAERPRALVEECARLAGDAARRAGPARGRAARRRRAMSAAYPEDLRQQVEDYLATLRFVGGARARGRPRGGDALLAARRRQAHPAGAGARDRRGGRARARRGAAARRGDRDDPHLLADPRRPAGDGRRRPAPRAPTCHMAFGEDVAILAGDGLFAEAFRLVLTQQQGEPERDRSPPSASWPRATGVERHGRRAVPRRDRERATAGAEDGCARLHELKTGALIARVGRAARCVLEGSADLPQSCSGASRASSASCSRSSTTSST